MATTNTICLKEYARAWFGHRILLEGGVFGALDEHSWSDLVVPGPECENISLQLWAPDSNGSAAGLRSQLNMKVVPLDDKVVVKRLAAEEMTSGGLLLPDAAREKPQQGRVLSVGDGRLLGSGSRIPHQVSEGDRVLFQNWAGTEVVINGQELLILSEEQILAIVK
jgi:chaperonin GroES